MMNNKRIASELNRIAKGLVSSGEVANTEGEYKKFTGNIKWRGSQGKVRNATFKLVRDGIIWEDGIWERGIWKDGVWKDGVWKWGDWEDGRWERGIWKDGTWMKGTWKRGKWEYGLNKQGEEHLDSPNNW